MADEEALRRVETWLTDVVVGLNLCPFAAPVVRQKLLRIVIRPDSTPSAILGVMIDEILLLTDDTAAHRTTLVAAPATLQDFAAFLDLVAQVDQILDQIGLRGRVQLAHFHPHYVFEGVDAADHSHWSNRAPYPMLHLLREDDVEVAVARYPDVAAIPARNSERLRSMSLSELKRVVLGES